MAVPLDRRQSAQRAYLNANRTAPARTWNFRGPLNGVVQVFAIQDVVSRELLFGFREGAVGRERFSVLDTDGGGGRSRLQRLGALKNSLLARFVHYSPVRSLHVLHF